MGFLGQNWLIWVTLLGLSGSALGISRFEMFPYGPSAGDELINSGNDQTREFTLDQPLVLYDGKFSKIYVSLHFILFYYFCWCFFCPRISRVGVCNPCI